MGLILGKIIEESFSQAMVIHDNSLLAMLDRPLVLVFFALTVLSLAGPLLSALIRRWRGGRDLEATAEGE